MAEDNEVVVEDVIEDAIDTPQGGASEEEQNEARQFGWVPKEEFRGKEEDWRDADEFIARGREINGYLRNDLAKIKSALSSKDSELAEMRDTMKEFKKFHETVRERSYKEALADLKRQKVEAIELQDGKAVVEIDDSINQLTDEYKTSQKEEPKPTKQNAVNEDYIQWVEENTWYSTKPELKAVAELYGEEILAGNPNLKGREFLEAVTKRVKQRFPEEFTNPARRSATVSSGGEGRTESRGKKKGFNDLPPEAKTACLKFEKQGLLTKEEYLAEYDWE